MALARLGQGTVARLVLRLATRVLALPLERFERLDAGALTAALTEDVAIVANALVGLPVIGINLPVVLACLAYGAWLSPTVLACGLGFAAPAVLGYVAIERFGHAAPPVRPGRPGRAGRAPPRPPRRLPRAEAAPRPPRRLRRRGPGARRRRRPRPDRRRPARPSPWRAAGASSPCSAFIGALLFVLPRLAALDPATLVGAVLVVLFLMPSLDAVVNWLPVLGRGRASLEKIEALLPGPDGPPRRAATRPDPAPAGRSSWPGPPTPTPTTARPASSSGRSTWRSDPARSSSWPAATAAARRPWSSCWPASTGRRPAPSCSTAGPSPTRRPSRTASSSRSSSPTATCSAPCSGIDVDRMAREADDELHRLGLEGRVADRGRRVLDDRPVGRAAASARPAGGLAGGPAGLHLRRVGRQPGPRVAAGLLRRGPARAPGPRQGDRRGQPRRGIVRGRRPRRPAPRRPGRRRRGRRGGPPEFGSTPATINR